jgi:SAM-dependent methyltransferase
MKKFKFIFREINKGKSLIRSYLNYHLQSLEIKGKTIDIGGGSGEGYISFMKRLEDVEFQTFDLKVGNSVDFEKDQLPAEDGTYDTVLFLNVMEHIFNHQHIANEVMRITKTDGVVIGYVPFLMWYHPDHRDFFRYTHEAIEIIFKKAGAQNIEIVPNYCGPFIAAAQMMLLSLPKFIRPFFFTMFYFLEIAH